MTVALLGIGTELTRGDIANTNGSWLARELTDLGFEVAAIDVVDDDKQRIQTALLRLAQAHELVICTGGLGPTTDDITTECVANLLGVALELHGPSLSAIEARIKRFGRTPSDSNRKQAYFPAGAAIMPNSNGTAPGFSVIIDNCRLFFVPGVPAEMRSMFVEQIQPNLGLPKERTPFEILFHTFGVPEATLNDRLVGIEAEYGVTIGYRVRFPEIDVKVLSRDLNLEHARHRAEQASKALRTILADCIYGEGKDTLPEIIGRRLLALGDKLAVAESCTGGLLASLITEQPGVSSWFLGSVVSYDNSVKLDVLNVPQAVIEDHGAVSVETADAMANGVAKLMGAPYAIAITGIAGPSGGTTEKPVGTVCFAIRTPTGTTTFRELFSGDRLRIQRVSAYRGLLLLRAALAAQ